MNCGLFGKLPAKRDFIALNAPSAFLAIYEKWLQGGLTASRLELGPRWQGAYLNAPIWRFWLGSAHAGQTVAGAFMPSVDGVGRYFPLTVFAATGATIPPPELDPQDGWFAAIEDFLLRALEPEASFEAVAQRLDALPLPNDQHLAAPPADMVRLSDGSIASAAISSGFPSGSPPCASRIMPAPMPMPAISGPSAARISSRWRSPGRPCPILICSPACSPAASMPIFRTRQDMRAMP